MAALLEIYIITSNYLVVPGNPSDCTFSISSECVIPRSGEGQFEQGKRKRGMQIETYGGSTQFMEQPASAMAAKWPTSCLTT